MHLSAGITAAIAAASLGTAALIYGAGYRAGQGEAAREDLEGIKTFIGEQQRQSAGFEDDRRELQAFADQLRGELAAIAARRPAPAVCRLDPDRLRVWNAAATVAAGEPDGAVPGSAGADGSQPGRGH